MRVAALALLVGCAAHAGVLEDVRHRMTPFTALAADFTQQKQVQGLTRPLTSTGHLAFQRGKGLLWIVEKPVASETVMTDSALIQRVKGRVAVRLDVKAQPGLKVLSRVFLAMVTGEWEGLAQDFDVSGDASGKAWTLKLRPRGGLFARLAESVELSGGAVVERVVMHEKNGDTTTITFTSPRLDAPLTADEEAMFAAP